MAGSDERGMIRRINHIGIATPSLADSIAQYRTLLGARAIGTPFDFPSQQVRICFVDFPDGQVELMEPMAGDGPVAKFLASHPRGGQHHICYEVPDIAAARDHLVESGAMLVRGGVPQIGSHGVPVIFVHPRTMGGVLVELMAEPGGH